MTNLNRLTACTLGLTLRTTFFCNAASVERPRFQWAPGVLGFTCVLALFAFSCSRSDASTVIMTMEGRFGTGSTLGMTPLDNDDTYVITALLDTTVDLHPSFPGNGFYPAISVTINVNGTDYAASDPQGEGLAGELRDPDAAGNLDNEYLLFFGTHNTSTDFHRESIADVWDTATPPFDADAPSTSVLSDFDRIAIGTPLVVTLAGAGDLTFVGSDRLATAGSLNGVPEPSVLALSCVGAIFGLFSRRSRQRRPAE